MAHPGQGLKERTTLRRRSHQSYMDLPDSLGHSSSHDVSSPILRLWRLSPSSDDSAGSKMISGTSPSSCTPAMLVHVSHLANELLDTVYLPRGQPQAESAWLLEA